MAGRFATLSPRMRRLVRAALALMAAQVLLVALRVAEFVSGAPADVWVPTTLLMLAFPAAAIGQSLLMRRVRLAEAAERERAAAEREKLLRLHAPNPAPGQCPVCALTDLDDLAAGDALLEYEGTGWARVVAYGPGRAHSECAAVVPYVASPRSTSPGAAAHGGCAAAGKPRLCVCPQCEKNRPRSPESWRELGFLRHEVQAWSGAGFTPGRAADLREQGFTLPRHLPEWLRDPR